MFDITHGKGFHMTFDNGFKASVQWGFGNYCDNRSMLQHDFEGKTAPASSTAEVAAFTPSGEFVAMSNGDDVMGHLNANEVLAFLNAVAGLSVDSVSEVLQITG